MKKTLERKEQAEFRYAGFGFPVLLLDVPMVRVRGAWTPDVDYDRLAARLLEALAHKAARLTGNEVRFIRHRLVMTLEQFARRFGVTHPAVLKWEQTGNRPTNMNWATEKDIRLEILKATSDPARFVKAYAELVEQPAAKPQRLRLSVTA